jgi:hypothetical protein
MATINRRIAIRDARAAREGNSSKKRGDVHALSVRLDHEQYRRLRRFVTSHEDVTGRRVTHQAVLEIALSEYLERYDPPSG